MEKTSSSIEAEPAAVAAATISSIFIYPIKSCRGVSVPHASITPTDYGGTLCCTSFASGNKTFSIFENKDFILIGPVHWPQQSVNLFNLFLKGRAYTQRVEPKLALVDVDLPIDAFSGSWEPTKASYMVIKAPGMDLLKVSLSKPTEIADGVSVREWSGCALDEGDEASKWFTTYLGNPSRLVRFNAASETRPVDPVYACGHNIMFSDEYPFMLISQGSLDALNKLLKEPLPINRFRPNIFVDGCDPFSEDLWTQIKISHSSFLAVKLCSRCKIPTINQDTAIAGPEPNEALRKFRSDKVLRPDTKPQGKIYFGQNLVCKESIEGKAKMVRVGDPIFVLHKVSSAAEAAA